ncbi:MAG: hypothetical protein ACYCX2_02180 [Christensenellales bacterium]
MKRFFVLLLLVTAAALVFTSCVQIEGADLANVKEYAKAIPPWLIIVGAIVLFAIGFSVIWKLIPGFIKVVAVIALAVIIAGVAYGLWKIPLVSDSINKVDEFINQPQATATVSPAATPKK